MSLGSIYKSIDEHKVCVFYSRNRNNVVARFSSKTEIPASYLGTRVDSMYHGMGDTIEFVVM